MKTQNKLDSAAEHRRRLLEGMAQTVARKGFADATIADIVTLAKVSRRTFYEHFSTREECLIALYDSASASAFGVLTSAIDPRQDWREQLDTALQRYLGVLATSPALLKTLFIAVFALGEAGLAARRRSNDRLVQFIIQTVATPATDRRSHPPVLGDLPDRELVTALVGGINELILQAIENGREDRLTDLVPAAVQLLLRGLAKSDLGSMQATGV